MTFEQEYLVLASVFVGFAAGVVVVLIFGSFNRWLDFLLLLVSKKYLKANDDKVDKHNRDNGNDGKPPYKLWNLRKVKHILTPKPKQQRSLLWKNTATDKAADSLRWATFLICTPLVQIRRLAHHQPTPYRPICRLPRRATLFLMIKQKIIP